MADSPLTIRVSQALGLTTSAFAAGLNLSLSYIMIPRLLEAPTPTMLRQWEGVYNTGKTTIPPIALTSAVAYFYLAYRHYVGVESFTDLLSNQHWKVRMYIFAGLSAFAIGPYTFAILLPTNNKLFAKNKETRELAAGATLTEVGLPKEETAHALVDKWGILNLGRAGLLIASAITGTWAALN